MKPLGTIAVYSTDTPRHARQRVDETAIMDPRSLGPRT